MLPLNKLLKFKVFFENTLIWVDRMKNQRGVAAPNIVYLPMRPMRAHVSYTNVRRKKIKP